MSCADPARSRQYDRSASPIALDIGQIQVAVPLPDVIVVFRGSNDPGCETGIASVKSVELLDAFCSWRPQAVPELP